MPTTKKLTGKASVDKPWMKYYPAEFVESIKIPECTMNQYLQFNMPGLDVPAIHYYGTDITWKNVFANAEKIARSLRALGYGEGDRIPSFLRSVPEFISLLLAAEKIGAAILCRMNSLKENVASVAKAESTIMFAHDFMTMDEVNTFLNGSNIKRIVLLSPCNSCDRNDMPDYIQKNLDGFYGENLAQGPATMTWDEFIALGETYTGEVEAPINIDRPLYCCYTSGSTGPSKQVIHSAHSLIGVLAQMNFYGGMEGVRPTWMVTVLPPTLVAVVTSMMLLPLASNKLLIQNPWVDVDDIDLELMRYKPNNWPLIPMFMESLLLSKRIPEDYDMSHLVTAGAGAEACNNSQLTAFRAFMDKHNCHVPFTTGYGASEVGSNLTFHVSGRPVGNFNVGCPMPLTTVAIFKPGTDEEVPYNEFGEICVVGPGVMLGYDSEEANAKIFKKHSDGQVWLHTGDIGAIDEDGNIRNAGRGSNKRYGGGFLDLLIMENRVADAKIPGIRDQFFVNVPDTDHEGYLLPYLYVCLEEGVTVEQIEEAVLEVLDPHMYPVEIIQIDRRPYWQFKTNRFGLAKEILAKQAEAEAAKEEGRIKVTWSANECATGYEICYSDNELFANAKTVRVPSARTVKEVIGGLKAGIRYFVKVRAYRKSATTKFYSAWSEVQSIIHAQITAENDGKGIDLTWTSIEEATEYRVYRKVLGEKEGIKLATLRNSNTYLDKQVENGVNYCYYVGIITNEEKIATNVATQMFLQAPSIDKLWNN